MVRKMLHCHWSHVINMIIIKAMSILDSKVSMNITRGVRDTCRCQQYRPAHPTAVANLKATQGNRKFLLST